jgi:hypothetical protein
MEPILTYEDDTTVFEDELYDHVCDMVTAALFRKKAIEHLTKEIMALRNELLGPHVIRNNEDVTAYRNFTEDVKSKIALLQDEVAIQQAGLDEAKDRIQDAMRYMDGATVRVSTTEGIFDISLRNTLNKELEIVYRGREGA